MLNKEILSELGQVLRQRGDVTKEQREFARVEEQAMNEMYPLMKPEEEVRQSQYRTLERYIGSQNTKKILKWSS